MTAHSISNPAAVYLDLDDYVVITFLLFCNCLIYYNIVTTAPETVRTDNKRNDSDHALGGVAPLMDVSLLALESRSTDDPVHSKHAPEDGEMVVPSYGVSVGNDAVGDAVG